MQFNLAFYSMDKRQLDKALSQFKEGYTDFLDTPKLVSQQSIGPPLGPDVQLWGFEVDAANELLAKSQTRRYVRTNFPKVKNLVQPNVKGVEDTEQSTLRSFFPETFQQNRYEVAVKVIL